MTAHSYPFDTVQPSRLDMAYRMEGRIPPCVGHSMHDDQPSVDFGMNAYQEATNATAIYPQDKALQYLSTGLAGEVGELCSKVAKHYRKDGELDYRGVASELGDILWFVAQMAEHLGYDLADIATDNLNKLRSRKERGTLQGNGDYR
jgi:NTP pyrophosphatase (non-canonical NTP hydrolase)